MAYSYLEYAESLKEENPDVALLYYENAIELSGLSAYFEEDNLGQALTRINETDRKSIFLVLLGFSLGLSLSIIIIGLFNRTVRNMPNNNTSINSQRNVPIKRTYTRRILSPNRKKAKPQVKLKKISR